MLGLRSPYFCSGCPHNTSTRVPDGMRAYAGIGCHYMAQWMDRSTEGFTQMGGEGANWVGEAAFSKRPHVFQNLGDGTYNHSGILAIRFAVTAGVNITYKILFNGVVAMTGGQRLEGHLTPDKIARQVAAEGVARIAIVTDEPGKYRKDSQWPDGATIRHRRDLDSVQRELAAAPGVTVLIYDQGCASEKRRQRKRGEAPDPGRRVIINELVCEGCGDCGVKSNCVSVQPVETEFGRKRMIDQSSCNKDFSCIEGFCPSFVTVRGAQPKRAHFRIDSDPPLPPRPQIPEIGARPYGILVTGVGGTGVVTIGAILGMAAHLESKGCGSIDMAGLAQKGGAVFSHVKIARSPGDIHAIRVAAGEADLVLGCDLVVSSSKTVLAAMRAGETGVLVNTAEIYPGDFTRNAEFRLPTDRMKRAIRRAAGETVGFIDATWVATALLGNSIAANMFMLGHAWQQGLVPLNDSSLLRALELNGEAVEMNQQAFLWGRRHAADPGAIEALAARLHAPALAAAQPESLDQFVARRVEFLTAYQNAAYAARFRKLVDRAAAVERVRVPGSEALTEAVARSFFKLMAIKDEYEVARLYSDGSFARQLAATFEGDLKLEYHLAPPFLARKNPNGEPRKMTFGTWMKPVFKMLASLKVLRATPLDVFGYTDERRTERRLIDDYEILLNQMLDKLRAENIGIAQSIAAIPEKIRGFGHIKTRNLRAAKAEEQVLLAQFHVCAPLKLAAE
jgi:indolepyruvate ferredoxin oxidoreductase